MKQFKQIVVWSLVLTACKPPAPEANEYTVLDTVQIDGQEFEFYLDLGNDSAVLGFMVQYGKGAPRYYPLYASTYRGLPSVAIDVYVSESGDTMWVRSSWKGYENLAVHRIGTDSCTTFYGEVSSSDHPTPESFGGGSGQFPAFDGSKLTKVARINHVK